MKIRIYYEDTDANNIVYHTAYMRFCERARSEIFFKNGKSPMSKNSFFVVKNINANFKGSVTLGDEVEVETLIKDMKKTSAIMYQKVLHNNKIIFDMDVTIVYLEGNKITRIPQDTQDILLAL